MSDKKSDMFKAFYKKKQHNDGFLTSENTNSSFSSVDISITDLKDVLHRMHTDKAPAKNTVQKTVPKSEPTINPQPKKSVEEKFPEVPLYEIKPRSTHTTISKEDIMREIREKARAQVRSSYAEAQPLNVTETKTVVEPVPAPTKFHQTLDKITAQETPLKETVYTPEIKPEAQPTSAPIVEAEPKKEEITSTKPEKEAEKQATEQPVKKVKEKTVVKAEPTPEYDTPFGQVHAESVYKTSLSEAFASFIEYIKKECNKKAAAVFASVAAALVVVATFTANFSFAFAAHVNGEYVGIVDDKTQCEEFINEINTVLESVGEDEKIDEKVSMVPRIIKKDAYTPEEDLRSAIYALSDGVQDMFVIYAGNQPLCALQSMDAAKEAITSFEMLYTNGDSNVQFSTSEPLEIKEEPVPIKTCKNVGEAINILNGTEKKEGEYVVQSGDTLWSIARAYDTTVDDLVSLNPSKADEIQIGDTLRVMAYNPVVTVTTVTRVEYDETIDYTTEVIETDSMYRGNSRITQEGEDGKRHIVADLVKVNGLEVRRDVIEETVIKEAVTQIKKVGTAEPPKGYGTGTFIRPCSGTISSYFGTRRSGYHKGIDIANSYGTPIYAADNGRVIYAGWNNTGFGRLVKLDHQNGYISYYGHNSSIVVKVGQAVNKGDVIAYMGSTGNSTGNHCHFELYKNGRLVNPYSYIF
ncbi:MAG: peptidoglycan DD-metalloendopeptidase family protein [Clostridia bacterium]|nr:peptidoglycan DD-metalloendopeptidase family protein [Clostridia bacterium]